MNIRSFRFLMGWSREDLAKRSGVSLAAVYLFERLGTAGSEGDALITRLLKKLRRQPFCAAEPLGLNSAASSQRCSRDQTLKQLANRLLRTGLQP